MVEKRPNPYDSPSVTGETRLSSIPWLEWSLLANILVFLGIVTTRSAISQYYLQFEVELPDVTKIALGALLPSVLMLLLTMQGVSYKRPAMYKLRVKWVFVEFALIGTAAAFYMFSVVLIEASITRSLS